MSTFYLDYNVTGDERKRLVKAIAAFTKADAKYLGAPTFAYEVDYFIIDRKGCVSFDDRADSEEIEGLIDVLVGQGFVAQVSDRGIPAAEAEEPGQATEEPTSPTTEPATAAGTRPGVVLASSARGPSLSQKKSIEGMPSSMPM